MFGWFKKKPLELKYGRNNYVSDYKNYEVNDDNWILLLSAMFVEAKDLDMEEKRARHDLLAIYEEGALDEDEKEELNNDLTLNDVGGVKKRMDQVSALISRRFEDDVYHVINSNSLAEVKAKALEKYEDDEGKRELFEDIWEKRDVYEHTHFRLGFIAQSMFQIRVAHYFGIVHEDVAWTYLKRLADFARPLMTLFDSWEAYNLNIQQFHEVYEYDYPSERSYFERAMVALNKREESPLQLISFDFGVDKSYAYNIKSHSNKLPKRIPSGQYPIRLMLSELLEREDKTQLWEEMDKLNPKEYEKEVAFVIDRCREALDEEDILELPERYENHYAFNIRANYFYNFAWEARGTGTSDTVGQENYKLFYERLEWALEDLFKAYEFNPNDRNTWHDLYEILSHFHTEEAKIKREEIYNLIKKKGLSHRGCVYGVSRFKQERWGGSFEENLDWAREVLENTEKGNDVRLIIFDVMIERYEYFYYMQDDEDQAKRFLENREIQSEVNQYFDEMLENLDDSPYNIVDTLCYWYSNVGDYERLRQVVHSMEVGKFNLDAMNDTYSEEYTEIIMNWFRSV